MSIWKKPITLEECKRTSENTATSHLGIEFTEVGDDYLVGRVPVDERTRQPFGLLHGGVSPVHIGRTTQVWAIEMVNEAGELTCVSRITMAMLAPR